MRQANRIRRQYLTSLLRQDFAFFDSCDTGALMARVVGDTNAIQEAVSTKAHLAFRTFSLVFIVFMLAPPPPSCPTCCTTALPASWAWSSRSCAGGSSRS